MACYALPGAKAPAAEQGSLSIPGMGTSPGPPEEAIALNPTTAKVAVTLPLPKMPPSMVPMDDGEKLQLDELEFKDEEVYGSIDQDDPFMEPDYDFGPKTSQLLELAATEKTKASQTEDDRSHWGPIRHRAAAIVEMTFPGGDTNIFDSITSVAIFFNIIVMIWETDDSAKCFTAGKDEEECSETWLVVSNWVLLAFYTFEVVVRFTAWHLAFFRSRWNWLDFVVVFMGWAQPLMATSAKELEKINILRLTRILRIIRVAKILKRMPTLHQMIRGFMGAMEAMMWGLVLILVLLVIWAILAVELIHPINVTLEHDDPWCEKAFSSVFFSTLLFFQTLVAGDSWGACAVPIILVRPWLYVLFAVALVSVQLGFTNLVLAVIVDKAAEVRDGTKEDRANAQAKKEKESLSRWKDLLVEMDTDESGTINRAELMAGCQDEGVQTFLEQMNMTRRDLMGLFNLLDDGSNSIPYEQFIDAFQKAQSQDTRIYLMVMKFQMQKLEKIIAETLQDRFGELKQDLSSKTRYGDTSRTPRAASPCNRADMGCSPISAQSRASPPKSPKSSHTISPFHLPKAFFGAAEVGAAKEGVSSNHLVPPKHAGHQPKEDLRAPDFEASLPQPPNLSNDAVHSSAPPVPIPILASSSSSSSYFCSAAEQPCCSPSHHFLSRQPGSCACACACTCADCTCTPGCCSGQTPEHDLDHREDGNSSSCRGCSGCPLNSSCRSRRGTMSHCLLCHRSRGCVSGRCASAASLGLDCDCHLHTQEGLSRPSLPSSPTCSGRHRSWDDDSDFVLGCPSLCSAFLEQSTRLHLHHDAKDQMDDGVHTRRQQYCSPAMAMTAGRTSCPIDGLAEVEPRCIHRGAGTTCCSSFCTGIEPQQATPLLASGKQILEEARPGDPVSRSTRLFDEQLDRLQQSLEARLDALAAETTACCHRLERHGALISSWRSELALSARERTSKVDGSAPAPSPRDRDGDEGGEGEGDVAIRSCGLPCKDAASSVRADEGLTRNSSGDDVCVRSN